jgi:ABC-type enterochelin transport system permease subunit
MSDKVGFRMVDLLDIFKRGSLELIADNVINEIPDMMRQVRDPNVKKNFMLKAEEDFVFGWILGRILGKCEVALSGFGGWRQLEPSEYQEIYNIVFAKLQQIRNKIFEIG